MKTAATVILGLVVMAALVYGAFMFGAFVLNEGTGPDPSLQGTPPPPTSVLLLA